MGYRCSSRTALTNYGPRQFPEKLVPVVILKALRGEPIPVYGTGNNVRDWIYVGDHVEALHQVLARGTVGETYCIGGSTELRNIDLVRLICGVLDDLRPKDGGGPYADQIEFVSDRPGHDFRYAMDNGKIRAELGWEPKETARTGFDKTVRWYLDNQEWCESVLDGSYRMERLGAGEGGTNMETVA